MMKIILLILLLFELSLIISCTCNSKASTCDGCDKTYCHTSVKRCLDKMYSYNVGSVESCWCNRELIDSRVGPANKVNVKFQLCSSSVKCTAKNSACRTAFLWCWYSTESNTHFAGWEEFTYCSNPNAFLPFDILVSQTVEIDTEWNDETAPTSSSSTSPSTTSKTTTP